MGRVRIKFQQFHLVRLVVLRFKAESNAAHMFASAATALPQRCHAAGWDAALSPKAFVTVGKWKPEKPPDAEFPIHLGFLSFLLSFKETSVICEKVRPLSPVLSVPPVLGIGAIEAHSRGISRYDSGGHCLYRDASW